VGFGCGTGDGATDFAAAVMGLMSPMGPITDLTDPKGRLCGPVGKKVVEIRAIDG
jgi:hypothetical protein